MKKWNWLLMLLIAVCLAGFFAYIEIDKLRTDTVAPEIIIETQTLEASVRDPKSALVQGLSAEDDRDGDVTDSLVVENMTLKNTDGLVSVGYAAFDAAGNVAKAERDVQFADYESPKFTLNRPLAYVYGTNFDILSNIGAIDVLDGEIQHRVRAMPLEETSIAQLGTHQVLFQVSSSLGDTVKIALPVEVYEGDTFNATVTLKDYLIYMKKGESFSANRYLDSFTWLGEEVDLTQGIPANFEVKTKGQVMNQYPGTYVVEYRVTYTDRHETNSLYDRAYTGYTKLIVIVEG